MNEHDAISPDPSSSDASSFPEAEIGEDRQLPNLIQRIEQSADRAGVLDAVCREHPQLADRLRRWDRATGLLGQAGNEIGPDMPARLGDFILLERIATGGMGEIFRARQLGLDRVVAVKIIRRGRESAEAEERFFREQRTLSRLHQTHIVSIHSSGVQDDIHYFSMPYIHGASLSSVLRIARRRRSSEGQYDTPPLEQIAMETPVEIRHQSRARP